MLQYMTMKSFLSAGTGLFLGAITFAPSTRAETQYEQNLDKSFVVTPGGQVVVSADMGAIHIATGADDKLEIHVLRKIEGGDKAAADEWFSRHEVTFTQQ